MPLFPDKGGSLRELLSLLSGAPADEAQALLAQLHDRLGGLRVVPVFSSGRSEWDEHVAAGRAFYSAGYLASAVAALHQCVQLWNPSTNTDLLLFDASATADTDAVVRLVGKMCGTVLNSATRGVIVNARASAGQVVAGGSQAIIVAHDGVHDLAGAMQVARTWTPASVNDPQTSQFRTFFPEGAPDALRPRLLARLGPSTGYALEDATGANLNAMWFCFAWAEVPRGTT